MSSQLKFITSKGWQARFSQAFAEYGLPTRIPSNVHDPPAISCQRTDCAVCASIEITLRSGQICLCSKPTTVPKSVEHFLEILPGLMIVRPSYLRRIGEKSKDCLQPLCVQNGQFVMYRINETFESMILLFVCAISVFHRSSKAEYHALCSAPGTSMFAAAINILQKQTTFNEIQQLQGNLLCAMMYILMNNPVRAQTILQVIPLETIHLLERSATSSINYPSHSASFLHRAYTYLRFDLNENQEMDAFLWPNSLECFRLIEEIPTAGYVACTIQEMQKLLCDASRSSNLSEIQHFFEALKLVRQSLRYTWAWEDGTTPDPNDLLHTQLYFSFYNIQLCISLPILMIILRPSNRHYSEFSQDTSQRIVNTCMTAARQLSILAQELEPSSPLLHISQSW